MVSLSLLWTHSTLKRYHFLLLLYLGLSNGFLIPLMNLFYFEKISFSSIIIFRVIKWFPCPSYELFLLWKDIIFFYYIYSPFYYIYSPFDLFAKSTFFNWLPGLFHIKSVSPEYPNTDTLIRWINIKSFNY